MSNRAKWAHWRKTPPRKQWPVGLGLLAIGILLISVALEGIREHVLWMTRFSARFGTFIVQPTATLFVAGGVFIVLGIAFWCGRR